MENTAIKNNTEVKVNGTHAVVFVTDPGQVAATCYVGWGRADCDGGLYIRRRVFKTRRGAENFAALFFAGLRRWN